MLTITTIKTPCGAELGGEPSVDLGQEVSDLYASYSQNLRQRMGTLVRKADPRLASAIYALSPEAEARVKPKRVAEGMYGIGALFHWADSEVLWKIEKFKKFLSDEMKGFMSSYPDLADRRARVDQLYREGKVTDALERYQILESAYQAKDFSFAIDIGNLLLFRSKDLTVADRYFARAVKFGERSYPSYASFALLHRALIRFNLNGLDDAAHLAGLACELCPEMPETFFQHAQYQMLTDNHEQAIGSLRQAVKRDRLYLLKAQSEPVFHVLEEELIDLARQIAQPAQEDISVYVDTFREIKEQAEALDAEDCQPVQRVTELIRMDFASASKLEHLDAAMDALVSVRRLGELSKKFLVQVQQSVILQNRKVVEAKASLKAVRAQQSSLAVWIQKVSLLLAPALALSSCVVLVNDTHPDHMIQGFGIALGVAIGGVGVGRLLARVIGNDSDTSEAIQALKLEQQRAGFLDKTLKLVEDLPIMKDKKGESCCETL